MMTLEELRAELAIVVPHDSDLLSSIDSAIRVRDELRRDIECHRRTEQEIRKRLQRFNDPGARLEACVQVVLQTYRETEEAYLDASASLDALRKRIEDAPVAHVDDRVGAPERLMDIGYYEGQRVRLVRE